MRKVGELNTQIGQLKIKRSRIRAYIRVLAERDGLLIEFDEEVFTATVDSLTIHSAQSATVKLRDDSEVECMLPLMELER